MGHCFSAHSTAAAGGQKWKSPKKASADASYIKNSSSSTTKHNARKSSMSRRCMSLVKEQRARLYIIRRCVTMLLCWHKYGDV